VGDDVWRQIASGMKGVRNDGVACAVYTYIILIYYIHIRVFTTYEYHVTLNYIEQMMYL
jgi:hypothetical protein